MADSAPGPELVRTRLYLLGYLSRDSGLGRKDPGLTRALQAFQRDAGLVVDGNVGPETLAALEDLAAPEGVPDLSHWAARDDETGLLRRAVGRRLEALGLLEKRTRCKHTIRRRLRHFARVAEVLHLTEAQLQPTVSLGTPEALSTLAVLFDNELIAEGVAAYDAARSRALSEEDAALVRRFVSHVEMIASVESESQAQG